MLQYKWFGLLLHFCPWVRHFDIGKAQGRGKIQVPSASFRKITPVG